jgi:hypothetical protein
MVSQPGKVGAAKAESWSLSLVGWQPRKMIERRLERLPAFEQDRALIVGLNVPGIEFQDLSVGCQRLPHGVVVGLILLGEVAQVQASCAHHQRIP